MPTRLPLASGQERWLQVQTQGLWSQTLSSQQSFALSQSPGNSAELRGDKLCPGDKGPMGLPSGMAKAQS